MTTLLINAVAVCLLGGMFLWVAPGRAQAPESETAFLRERVVIKSSVGITGFAAGTRVTIITRHGDKVLVKTAEQQFEVTADQIIADPQAASSLLQREVHQQDILQKEAAEREAKYRESVANLQKLRSSSSTKADKDNNVDRQLSEIRKQRELLRIELDKIKFEQKDLPPPNSSYPKYWPHNRGSNVVVQTSPNGFKLQQQRKDIERRLMELDQQERILKLESK